MWPLLSKQQRSAKIEIQCGFTTKTWKIKQKKHAFDVDLHSGSRAGEDSRWHPVPARLAFLSDETS